MGLVCRLIFVEGCSSSVVQFRNRQTRGWTNSYWYWFEASGFLTHWQTIKVKILATDIGWSFVQAMATDVLGMVLKDAGTRWYDSVCNNTIGRLMGRSRSPLSSRVLAVGLALDAFSARLTKNERNGIAGADEHHFLTHSRALSITILHLIL